MRIAATVLKALPGTLALVWAVAGWAALGGTAGNPIPAADPGTRSAVLPSIEILAKQTNLAGTCGAASTFDLNTFINVDTQASTDVLLTAPVAGTIKTIEQFTDETGSHIGPFNGTYPNFQILGFGGGLAPNTPITITITTYTGHNLSGNVSYVSTLQYNCKTGTILSLADDPPSPSVTIPTLTDAALATTAALIALVGLLALRRRALVARDPRSPRSPRRP